MGKNIRFSELVKRYGRPYVATLWAKPDSDPGFSRAIRENRVLTVMQQNVGAKKDFGTIGFQQQSNASYFIFPRPLPREEGHVVGIKYEMAEHPRIKGPLVSREAIPKRTLTSSKDSRRAARAAVEEKEFTAVIRRTAVWETAIQIKARTKSEAMEKARAAATKEELPRSEAVVRNEVRSVSESH